MSVCTRCGVELVPEVNWSKGMVKSNTHMCRKCNSAKGKEWYAKNKEKAISGRAKLLSMSEDTRMKRAEYRKKYYEEHKEHHSKLVRSLYRRNRKIPERKAQMMLTWIRSRAKRKNLDFDIDKEFILRKLEKGVCEVTGLRLDLEDEGRNGARINPYGPSIDRIDPEQGYIKSNCRMVVWIYNVAKQDFSDDDVMVLATALVSSKGDQYEGSRVG